jgi:ABC-type transport system involved in multi-copper enzyme maturation permease subunit
MTVKEKGYSHWTGEFEEKKIPWWPITRYGIKLTFKRKFFKLFFFMTLIPAFGYLVGIYISERIEDFNFMVREGAEIFTVNPAFFKNYMTSDFLLFMIVMIMVFCGSGLISDDLKYNSLQLYFSRPLKKGQYLTGKGAVVFFFLFMVTLVPGIVFIIMKLIFAGNFRFIQQYPWLILSVMVYSVFITGFFAFYAMLLSSLNKNRRYVSVLIFGLYLFTDIIFGIFFGIFKSKYFSLLSLKVNLQQVGAVLFKQKTPYDIPWLYSFIILFLVCVVSALVLRKKVSGVEIIK